MPRQIDLFPQNLQVKNDPNNQIGVTSAQISHLNAQIPAALAAAEAAFINSILTAIDQATGLDLVDWAQELETLFSGSSNVLTAFTTAATNAWNNWVATFDNLEQASVNEFTSWLQTLLEPNSPLNAGNLWGLLPTYVAGSIASTAVNSTTPNPLINPNFEAAISVSPGSGWVWDSTVYYSTSVNMPGSAKVVADGGTHGLRSNPVPVQGGQTISLTAQILTSGYTGSGTPIEVDVVTYLGNTQVAQTTVQASGAPSGATTSWVNAPSGSVAGTLTGTFTVPGSGVDSVVVRLGVGASATAGSVWFGSVAASLSGGLIATIQSDLSSLSSDFTAGNTAFATFLQAALGDITGYTSWSTFITNLESQWNTYVTTATSLTSAEFFTIQQLINTLIGVDPSTGLLPQSQINGLASSLSALLGTTTFQALLDGVANALGHSGTGHTITDVETYLGIIPPANVTNVLGQSSLGADVQAILDYIANALGHSGTGHTLTQIETYLGLIPSGNVTNVLGNSSLGADVQAMVDDVTNLFSGNSSSGNALSALVSDGEAALNALLPGVFDNNDGTLSAAANSGIVDNGDGTLTYGSSAPYYMFDNGDGTVSTAASALQNMGTGVGTNNYAVSTASTAHQNILDTWTQQYGVPALNAITTAEQDIATFISNALSGGNAPSASQQLGVTSPVAYLEGLLGLIPHTNVVIPPSPGSGSITHDANASGTPYTSFTNNFVTLTWNHTCGATANYLTMRLGYYSIYLPAISVTYNGVAMSPLVSQKGTDGDTYIAMYGLANPATGISAQVSVTMYSPLGNAIDCVAAESDSYIGVGSVGSTDSNAGTSSNPSLTVPSVSGDYIVQAFVNSDSFGATLSSYNQTSQYNSGNLNPNSGPNFCLLAGDAAGASSVSFTATALDTSSNRWAAAAVNLTPLPAAVIGSVFRAANTSTSTVSASSGNNLFVNGFFGTTVTNSDDLTYAPSTFNEVTITHAGSYSVTIAVLMVSTFNNQFLGLNLVQNGNTKRGNTPLVSNAGFNTNIVVSHTFQVYCSAGDTLQPGYYSSASGSAFTGTTDGLSTYFEVSLNNRGLHS